MLAFAEMAMVQNQWYHFGIAAPSILTFVGIESDVLGLTGLSTHGHMAVGET